MTRFALLFSVFCIGCASEPPAPPAPPPQVSEPRLLAHEWNDNVLTVPEMGRGVKLRVDCCTAATIRGWTNGWRKGTALTIAGQPVAATVQRGHTDVALSAYMGGLDISHLHPDAKRGTRPVPFTFTVPVTVQFDGPWVLIETESPEFTTNGHSAGVFMSGASEGPILFQDDVEKAKADTAFLVWRDGNRVVFGPGVTLNQIDWVIHEKWVPMDKTKRCGGYSNVKGFAGDLTVDVRLASSLLTIIDRRTGETVREQHFDVEPGCPSWASGKSASRGASQQKMKRWVKAFVASGEFSAVAAPPKPATSGKTPFKKQQLNDGGGMDRLKDQLKGL